MYCRVNSEEEAHVKKNLTREEKKPRRLILSRETIKLLSDPALLAAARGGNLVPIGETTTERPTGCP
jgi:hypothetical protein